MSDNLNLNDIAEAYLSLGLPDRLEYERLLIRSRGDAIIPLFRAILILIAKRKHLIDARVKEARSLPKIQRQVAEDTVRELWARGVIEPLLQDAYDVIRRLDPLVQGVLCGTLLHDDYKIRLVAALLLARNDSPDKKLQQLLQLNVVRLQRKYKNQGILVRVLGIVLFYMGADEWKKLLEDEAQKNSATVEEWIKFLKTSALIELSK